MAIKLANAAGDGVYDMDVEVSTAIKILDQLRMDDSAKRQRMVLQLPAFKPQKSRATEHVPNADLNTKHGQASATESEDQDMLAYLYSESSPDHDPVKHTPKDLDTPLVHELMQAAHQCLISDPHRVLRQMLVRMSNNMRNPVVAPYMLAALENGRQHLENDRQRLVGGSSGGSRIPNHIGDLAALDIEKLTQCPGVQSSPDSADLAADGEEPIAVLEIGLAVGMYTRAVKVQSILDLEEEATTGKRGSSDSKLYRSDAKAEAVNKKTYGDVNNPNRNPQPQIQPTVRAAWREVLREPGIASGDPVLTHNCSGFNEKHA